MADRLETERVLSNWIAQATQPPGRLADGVEPANWIARQFLNWWWSEVEGDLSDAERAVLAIRQELQQLGGWDNPQLGEALHELTHASEALASLRITFGSKLATEEQP
jgi:hypothetical protein